MCVRARVVRRRVGVGGTGHTSDYGDWRERQVLIRSWSVRYGAYLCDVQEAPRAAAGQVDQWGYRIPVLHEGQQACMN